MTRIRAGAFGAGRRAGVVVLAGDRVDAAAASACQKATEQELPPVRPVERVAGVVLAHLDLNHLLPLLSPVPQGVVDDTKLGYGNDLTRR